MQRTILIHANCCNPDAKGDFAFAGNIAKDLVSAIHLQSLDLSVVLVSLLNGISRFENLYGKADKYGKVIIEGVSVGLSSLENFNTVDNQVIAFIDANRCKYSPGDMIKRVISPECKFLFVGNVNQPSISTFYAKILYHNMIRDQQSGLYDNFDQRDMLIASAGFGSERIGIPMITAIAELASLPASQAFLLPADHYGFMYLANLGRTDSQLIAQYIELTAEQNYILVGNFGNQEPAIQAACSRNSMSTLPNIIYHESLPNSTMRQLMARASSKLVLSTGVTSTLEVFENQKLPYYQYMENNAEFVQSYLLAISDIVTNNPSINATGNMATLVISLSKLLFTEKPLISQDSQTLKSLMGIDAVCEKLIGINQTLIAQAKGKIAPRLLSFITSQRKTKDISQLKAVIQSLRKFGEMNNPSPGQALRRAAAWGRPFDLKVLIKHIHSGSMIISIDDQDIRLGRTALHWAIRQNNIDCVRILINAGASPNTEDNNSNSPLDEASSQSMKEMLQTPDKKNGYVKTGS